MNAIRNLGFKMAIATVLVASVAHGNDECGVYPNCTEGSICVNGKTYVCHKQNNACGPTSTIDGCPNLSKSKKSVKADKAPDATSATPPKQKSVQSSKVSAGSRDCPWFGGTKPEGTRCETDCTYAPTIKSCAVKSCNNTVWASVGSTCTDISQGNHDCPELSCP
jgi:hypothetical protein